MVAGQLRWWMLRNLQHILRFGGRSFRKRQRRARFEITVELFESPLPTITFICDQALQHGQGCGLRVRAVLDGTGERRNPVESCVLGQVPAYLGIRIETGFLSAEE